MQPSKLLKLATAVLFIFISFTGYSQTKILLHTDFEGNVVSGSKEKLIEEIRKGYSVRVGWQLDFNKDGVGDFDHWAPAEFITILGNDVFTQIRNINVQLPYQDKPQVDIIPVNIMWTAILGTNSVLRNRSVYEDLELEYDEEGKAIMDEETEQQMKMREVSSWKVATFWAIEY